MSRRFPESPVLGVGALVFDEDRVLLVRRGRPPSQGQWSLPGGAVELGESVAQACGREVKEETGLEVKVGRLFEVVEWVIRDGEGRAEYHYVILDWFADVVGGKLEPGDDCAEVRWVALEEVKGMEVTEGLVEFLERARRERD